MQWWQLRRAANFVNLSTPLGLVVGVLGRAEFCAGPCGLVLATSYRLPMPSAAAFTVGDVVLSRHDLSWLRGRPALLRHEERHSRQYTVCLGLPMLPLYVLAAAYSYLRGGDFGVHNVFERAAGLEDGGYPPLSARARAAHHESGASTRDGLEVSFRRGHRRRTFAERPAHPRVRRR